jgi:NADH dehydrogenase FAD-containing subunit
MFANHDNNVKKPVQIIILGSGFAGVEVLKKLQKEFRNNDSIVITMISKDNYLLFTPMLPEVATGTVETRHIIAPIRSFCKNGSFHEATVQLIDLKNKRIVVMHKSVEIICRLIYASMCYSMIIWLLHWEAKIISLEWTK